MDTINWLSMALATATPLAIGRLYYHKAVFGTTLLQNVDSRAERTNQNKKILAYSLTLIVAFLLAFFLLNFNNSGINQEGDFDTFQHGAWHGTFLAITVATPVIVINGVQAQKTWKNILILISYWVICLALMGGILDVMNRWENIVLPEG
ncbi:MAG: DUF1761 domain-containing protein [Bacteroidota bacterium]